ncbi:TIGR02530 family flagellar biosynthesis protein [Pectinatus sottacetonis]|uniref:TIGR02530 family flagellar biosynthesis protein n=1 Tax=Pectinatus sottacetonis TaxID=1002795 RepID=UPI001E3BA415|nr:TIGR02530 family flagellar biosynthesis protein [Pectinatus sottacetonis]
MKINSNVYLQPLMPLGNQNTDTSLATKNITAKSSFASILKETAKPVTFSQHALARIKDRNIKLTDDLIEKLNNTVAKMAQKGAREGLVYLQGTAFVVSITNRTVITAMDGVSAKDNIFTNIDSAAIL